MSWEYLAGLIPVTGLLLIPEVNGLLRVAFLNRVSPVRLFVLEQLQHGE